MQAHGGIEKIVFFGKCQCFFAGGKIARRVNNKRNAVPGKRAEHGVAVFIKTLIVIMSMGVENSSVFHQCSLVPTGTESSIKVTQAEPSSLFPARSIPLDSTPQSFAGFRFATTIIFLPISSSGV